MQRGRVAGNVAQLVDAPTVRPPEVVPLTAAEARRLHAVADGLRNGARWSVALALGLRQGEALGLMWRTSTCGRHAARTPGSAEAEVDGALWGPVETPTPEDGTKTAPSDAG